MCASPVAGISSKHSPEHECMCVCWWTIVHMCMCVFGSVTERVCDQFPEATAANRVPEWRKLLCDNYQEVSLFATLLSVFPPLLPLITDSLTFSLFFFLLSLPRILNLSLLLLASIFPLIILPNHQSRKCCSPSVQSETHLSRLYLVQTCNNNRKEEGRSGGKKEKNIWKSVKGTNEGETKLKIKRRGYEE